MTEENKYSKEELQSFVDELFEKPKVPAELSNTNAYELQHVLFSNGNVKRVPDIEKGSDRSRRWAMLMYNSIIPGFDQVPEGPAVLPLPGAKLFDADSLEELYDRVLFELKVVFDKARCLQKVHGNKDAEDMLRIKTAAFFREENASTQG